ncbi:MAG: sugar kinase [Pseudomonadota bacterium]
MSNLDTTAGKSQLEGKCNLDVVTIGEAMALLVAQHPGSLSEVEPFRRTSAGAELNVAIGLSRLGFRVAYVSRVGSDAFGDYLRAVLRTEGIDQQYVKIDADRSTGIMFKSQAEGGEDPDIEYFRKGSAAAHMGPADNPGAICTSARHLHITGISVALSESVRQLVWEMATQARAAGVRVSFDPNLRPRLWPSQQTMVQCLNQFATLADVVMPGLSEGQLLSGRQTARDVAAFYLDLGVKQVVIKLGARGAYYASEAGHAAVPGLCAQKVVDTVGAGDGFAVGVISALLEGLPLEQAAERGNAIGARVVQFSGDCEGLPNRIQLAQALAAPRYREVPT